MKATINGQIIAESGETIARHDYDYFPVSTVRTEWLQKAPKTASDHRCPHGVQFYDIVIDGARYGRAAWVYEAPFGDLAVVEGRFGFWEAVSVTPSA